MNAWIQGIIEVLKTYPAESILTVEALILPIFLYFSIKSEKSRSIQVMLAGLISAIALVIMSQAIGYFVENKILDKKIWETGALWTLAALLISSPVAFVVWRFRDENQSKDINLKEFQKISEWVTGAHFQEEKHSEKFSGGQNHQANMLLISERSGELYPLNDQSKLPSERSREYYRPAASAQALHTFSKQDGAVGLQIAAVYNLLPFYRGDYGQAFEKPSVHLLLSAWKVLQHDILQELENADDETQKALIEQLHQRADSPLGQAITRVLLACDYADKPLLHRHPEVLRGICLSGMDFNLAGLEHKNLYKKLFYKQDLTGAQWQGVRMRLVMIYDDTRACPHLLMRRYFWHQSVSAALKILARCSTLRGFLLKKRLAKQIGTRPKEQWNLTQIVLNWANLNGARFLEVNLNDTQLIGANLNGTRFGNVNLSGARLLGANLNGTQFGRVNLLNANGMTVEQLSEAKTLKDSLINADNFSQYPQPEHQQLRDKGLIILHRGSDNITKYLVCKHKTNIFLGGKYDANSIPFKIDLTATQAANPDWEISIFKDDEEQ